MSGELPGLSVDSVTGIDVSLAIAGPGARAFAFLIDWTIRLILGLAWLGLGSVLYNGRFTLAPASANDARWFGGVLAPALAIYFLYHYVAELAMRGSTPGKRMAGVRLVSRDGAVPGAGALLTRNVFRLVDSLPLFYGVGLMAVMLTRDNLRIGDMAGGTVLVFEHAEARLSPPAGDPRAARLDALGAEIVTELLERWQALEPAARLRLAQQLLARYGDAADAPGAADSDAQWRARLEHLLHPPQEA